MNSFIRDLTDKANRNRFIESESGKESKGDIHISVVVTRIFYCGDGGSKWNSYLIVKELPFSHCQSDKDPSHTQF